MAKNNVPTNGEHSQPVHNRSNDPATEKRLQEILDLLYSFYAQKIDMSLDRVRRFLHQIGDPHLKLPPVIHVAGTNGKGSSVATLRSLLENDGHKVHVMISPHLVHPTERIRLAGNLISTQGLINILEECLSVNRQEPITFFEMFTAAGFLAMSRTPADYTILETGMGGRLDATNVIPQPACTIITTISKDHEKFLGSTLDKIAREKAGILKAGVPCITGYQIQDALDADVQKVFHEVSQSLSPVSPLYQYGSDWRIEEKENHLLWHWQEEQYSIQKPNLIGPHQKYNIGAALGAYRIIKGQAFDAQKLSPDNPCNPLGIIHWPGRLQKITQGTLIQYLKPQQELWLDGGHNDSAGLMLAQQAQIWQQQDARPLYLIVAMVDRKIPRDFLAPLVPHTEELLVTAIEHEESCFTKEELYHHALPLGFKALSMGNNAVQAIQAIKDPNARILITGSLYFIGSLME